MAGTISTLGIGSGIDLQGMLEQLREIDQQVVDAKSDKIKGYQDQLAEFTTVNNKLLTLKSSALNLSLSSNFLGRTVTSSDETVATATVVDGAVEQSDQLEVTRLAAKNSWLSASGAASADSSVYVPVSTESTTGVADSAATVVAHAGESMLITFGEADQIILNVAGDMTMDDLVTAINTHVDNVGAGDNGRLVTAETYDVEGETFLRIRSDLAAGTGESNRVAVNEDFADIDFAAPDTTFSFQVGEGDPVSITVAADTTLTELTALINDAEDNPGVTAAVINDGDASTPYRLTLQSNTIGEDGRITFLTQLADMTLDEQQGAGGESLNAQFSLDGISYQRQSNSFFDVISGVTITLESEGTTTITVGNNNANIKDMINGLVTAYNDAVQEVRTNSSYDAETGTFGSLFGTTLRDLPNTLRNLMTSTVRADETGKVTTLFDLGLEFNRDGTISLDEEILDAALADQPDAVSAFFIGDSDRDIQGFADMVNERMRTLTGSEGQIAGEQQSAQDRISDIELKVAAENDRLDRKYELMAKQFVELDRYMQQMTSLSDYLGSQFDSISNAWGGVGSSK
ncbi:MAG: flagellar filament capping protein FliD [Proteobacteria bacterium]|nr:flagellar filament capping protein FliD [Pseudomonadota bacterium]MBU4296705.1 flagellar filament capping protein FliD [Pseudomonadota bacterium]MCG2748498.1 flagellar filament capping protein FliD [Desulfobulbaceae bacterium]